MKRVCAYCRVSTDSEDQANSLTNQMSYFSREIEKANCTLVHVYADKGLTGTKLNNRPEFEQMIKDAGIDVSTIVTVIDRRRKVHTVYDISDREPLFDEIWVKNTSRFARNTLSYEIISYLRAKKVNVHFMSENIDTRDMSQDLLLKLMQVFDENDSKDKSAKVRWGNIESAKRGRIRCGRDIYGYTYNKEENTLTAIPEEAEVIREIFKLYSEGYGCRRIINILTEHGKFSRSGKPFCKSTITRIIDNEKYAGLNNALKWDTGIVFINKHSYSIRKSEYDVNPTDRIEPIVTQELFYKCKEIINSRVSHTSRVGIYNGIGEYIGLLFCSACSKPYYRNSDRGRIFYNCSTKRAKGTAYCSNPNVSAKQIDEAIDNLCMGLYYVKRVEEANMAMRWLVQEINKCLNRINSDSNTIVEQIDQQIEELSSTLDGYSDLYAVQRVNRESILQKINDLQDQIESLQKAKYEASKGNDQLKSDIQRYYDKVMQLYQTVVLPKDDEHPAQVDRDTLLSNISKIWIDNNAGKPSIRIELKLSREITDIVGSDRWRTEEVSEEFESPFLALSKMGDELRGIVT